MDRSRRVVLSLACVTAVALSAAAPALGQSPQPSTAVAAACETDPVTISLWDFQGETYLPQVEDFMAAHPCIAVDVKVSDFDAHHQALTTALASGSGVPDVAGIEIAMWDKFLAQPQNFVNLDEVGAQEIEADYLPWMWQMGGTPDGSAQIGIPVASAGLAIAYRKDLFEQAGLPTDRVEVAALWPTWADFVETCRKFTEATGVPFVDSLGQTYDGVLGQASTQYYEADGTLVHDSNPAVREAWDVATAIADAGCSAKLTPWTDDWTAGMGNGSFAAMVAPSWMQGVIAQAGPDHEGKWDIAALPGVVGNLGGSWLTIPAQAQHPAEAWEFISWILSPEQQLVTFNTQGSLPSTSSIFDSPDIQGMTSPYFSDAPVGEIYTASLTGLEGAYAGPDHNTIATEFQAGLSRVDQGTETADEAWASTMANIDLAIGQ